MKELDLKELELQEQALAELPDLRNELIVTIEAMSQRLDTMARYGKPEGTPRGVIKFDPVPDPDAIEKIRQATLELWVKD